MMTRFPKQIEDFADAFVTMQEKRHKADYDPGATFPKSEVLIEISRADAVIRSYRSAPTVDRRAFCAYVLFKHPRL